MKHSKRVLAILLVICISISFIACSRKPQHDANVEKDDHTETRTPTSDNAPLTEDESQNSETAKMDETTSTIETPVIPTIDLLSSFVEKYISFSGADGFGKLNMSFKDKNGVIASDGTASITCVGDYENYFTVSNGSDKFPAKIVASQTDALTTGDTITFSISYYDDNAAKNIGFNVAPFTVTVPELGTYITNSAQITDVIWQKIIDPDNWTGQEYSTMRSAAEGYLLCYAYPAYLLDKGEWETESKYGILLIIKNGSYISPYAYIFLTDIKTFSDGSVEARADGYDHSSSAYNVYQLFDNKIGKHFDVLMGEKHDINVSTLYPVITTDGRPQVELFAKFASDFAVSGNNGNGVLQIPSLGKEGTILHTEPHKDGDIYFIVSDSYANRIRIIQNNKQLAEFEWGASKTSGLSTGNTVQIGMWFRAINNTINTFDKLPFQFVPTTITVPTLGEIVMDASEFSNDIYAALGSVGDWNATRISDITYDNYGYDYRTPDNAKIVKIELLELRPQYALASKFTSKYFLMVYFEHEGYYYGLWCFDIIKTPDGQLKPKYVVEIVDATTVAFGSLARLEYAVYDDFAHTINRDAYIITTIYEQGAN